MVTAGECWRKAEGKVGVEEVVFTVACDMSVPLGATKWERFCIYVYHAFCRARLANVSFIPSVSHHHSSPNAVMSPCT